MKFQVSFKTPDAAEYAINGVLQYGEWADADERDELKSKLEATAEKFISYGECITVEFDSDTGTATVVPKRK